MGSPHNCETWQYFHHLRAYLVLVSFLCRLLRQGPRAITARSGVGTVAFPGAPRHCDRGGTRARGDLGWGLLALSGPCRVGGVCGRSASCTGLCWWGVWRLDSRNTAPGVTSATVIVGYAGADARVGGRPLPSLRGLLE